jgi:uncharacterized membrane protein
MNSSQTSAMAHAAPLEYTPLERVGDALLRLGLPVYALAIIGLGITAIVCAHKTMFLYALPSNPRFPASPVLPFFPTIPWLSYFYGAVEALLGIGLLFRRTRRTCALLLGVILFACTLILEVPRNIAIPSSMNLRTILFEPLAIASLAWLLPGPSAISNHLERLSRYLLGLSFVVFGIDHFLALAPIGTLIPNWIPWHVFWIAFFGAGFIAAGISIAFDVLLRWGAACIGLMYAIWVFTLHLPTVLGLYAMPGRSSHPALWSSLFIAVALWGGSWAVARSRMYTPSANLTAAPPETLGGRTREMMR